METLRRREKYFMNVELRLGPEQIAAGRRHSVRLHIINLRNRRLTIENLDTLSVSMPKLQRRLTGEPDPPGPTMADVRTDCLTSPFTYKSEDEENARRCPSVARPAQVMMTPAGFRPPAGTLLSPVHPGLVRIAALKADRGNDILHLEWEGRPYNRVVSAVYSAAGQEMNGWFRVSDYYEDGHMILSVLCYFPIVEKERVEQVEPQKKRKREDESSTDLTPRKCLRL